MAKLQLSISIFTLVFLITLMPFFVISQELQLSPAEQEAVYAVLDAVNPHVAWRTLFPDDLCSYGPHGVVCDLFSDDDDTLLHVSELSFGFVSDFTPNPTCSASSAVLSPLLFSSFPFLRKLFFYRCFTNDDVIAAFPDVIAATSLEEIVFIDNPSLVAPLSRVLSNFTSLKRVVLTGNGFVGNIPVSVAGMTSLEELTLAGNKLGGEIPARLFERIKKLKILDLAGNKFSGEVPASTGSLPELLKLDLSCNMFSGVIPASLGNLKSLELLDLSYNEFNGSGVPEFLPEMRNLKTVSLSGNKLGGKIPEFWCKLEGILGIGLSGVGLVGKIPNSMGLCLRSLRYLGLDNNKLEGTVPYEFGALLENVSEINLVNNSLRGKVSFSSARFGHKLKLSGNPNVCLDDDNDDEGLGFGVSKICGKQLRPKAAHFNLDSSVSSSAVKGVVASLVLVFWVIIIRVMLG